jgi:arginine exporter protein ArgO
MTSKSKKNNNFKMAEKVDEAVPVTPDPLAAELMDIVCLLGTFSQIFLSFKIIFVDREFPTLALSLVFFILFCYGYFSIASHVTLTKKWFLIQAVLILVVDVLCFGIMAIVLDKKAEIVTAGIGSFAFAEALPFVLWLVSLKTKHGTQK